jgi:hypothetical protein
MEEFGVSRQIVLRFGTVWEAPALRRIVSRSTFFSQPGLIALLLSARPSTDYLNSNMISLMISLVGAFAEYGISTALMPLSSFKRPS